MRAKSGSRTLWPLHLVSRLEKFPAWELNPNRAIQAFKYEAQTLS